MTTLLGRPIGLIGYGTMGLTRPTGSPTQEESFAALDAALDEGATYWNGGEFYGTPERNTLHLLNEYFTAHPEKADKIVLCIKGSRIPGTTTFQGDEAGIRRSVDECIRVLDGKKQLDIFECARVDPNVPIEDSIAILAKFVAEGKIKGIGLSEVRSETIRRAIKVHPIAQVEVELSLWSTDVLRNGVAETCAELGIPLMAYAPLSRGGLSTSLPQNPKDLPEHLQRFPRFQGEAYAANMKLTKAVEKLAKAKGCSIPQIAIGWVRSMSGRNGLGVIVPVPGAEKPEWVKENCSAPELTEAEMQELDKILHRIPIHGDRYHPAENKLNEG